MVTDISWCLLSADFYIILKNIFHVPDQVLVHVYVIIASSLKPYQNFGPDLSLDCLLMFSVMLPPVVIHDQRDRPTISKQTTGTLSGRWCHVSGHDAA